ncbi:MAG: ATP-binding protein [Actinomycetota bacterium]
MEADAPGAALTGQRRQVTVLFVDLVGSTALSYELDPEDLGEVVLAYQELGRAAVARFDGHVAQYLGDGLVAVFGYPTAHEGDTERAVRAAHALLADLDGLNATTAAALGIRLEARAGIATGVAVVGAMGSDDRVDTSVFGPTINLAARLEGIAEPGTIVLSDAARRLVDHCCTTIDLGTPRLKGVEDERVWRVDELASPGIRRTASHNDLMGRDAELAVLLDAWRRACDGEGGAIAIVGDAGIGKSRLVAELRARAGASTLTVQCSPLQTATPLAPLAAVLEGLDLLGGNPDATDADDKDVRWRRAIIAASEALGAALGRRPALLIAEDVHWADASTLEALTLLRARDGGGLLIVSTQRPDSDQELGGGERLVLDRLENEAAAEVIDGLLPQELPDRDEHARAILRRGEGIPLFLEELAATVTEGGGTADLPASLHDTLLSNLDRLGPAARTAQLAAVFGRDVHGGSLRALAGEEVDADLDALLRARLIVSIGSGSDVIYSFRHALIRDAAYDSLLRRDRRRLHAAVAELLEASHPDFAVEQPQVLAHHLAAAGRDLDAASLLRVAGRRAGERGAYAEASGLLARSLEILRAMPDDDAARSLELEVVTLLGNTTMGAEGYGARSTLEIWQAGVALSEAVGDLDALSATLNGEATFWLENGDCLRAAAIAERIHEAATPSQDRVGLLRAHTTLGLCRQYLGDPVASYEHSVRALELYRPGDYERVTFGLGSDHRVIALGAAAMSAWVQGRPDDAMSMARDAVAHGAAIGSRLSRSMGTVFVALTLHFRGEHADAIRACDELRDLASLLRYQYFVGFADLIGGGSIALTRDPRAGLEMVEAGLAALASTGAGSGASLGLSILAQAHAATGDLRSALGTVGLAQAFARDASQPFFDAELLRLEALYGFKAGVLGIEEARRTLRAAIADALERRADGLALRAATTWAALEVPPHRSEPLGHLRDLLARIDQGAATSDRTSATRLLDEQNALL